LIHQISQNEALSRMQLNYAKLLYTSAAIKTRNLS